MKRETQPKHNNVVANTIDALQRANKKLGEENDNLRKLNNYRRKIIVQQEQDIAELRRMNNVNNVKAACIQEAASNLQRFKNITAEAIQKHNERLTKLEQWKDRVTEPS